MSEFVSIEAFDLSFYHNDNLLFEMNKVKSVEFSTNEYNMHLTIKDATINKSVLDRITDGSLKSKEILVSGYSSWRNIKSNIDHDISLLIKECKFESYTLSLKSGDVSSVSIMFSLNKKDKNKEDNIIFKEDEV